jgi:predicted amidohydrolase
MTKAACFRIYSRHEDGGVLFDVGHGGAAMEFRQAVPAMRQGFPPDSISTDVHAGSLMAGMKDMLNVMSKFLNMEMPLNDVILRSTWNPAREIQREELGTFRWAHSRISPSFVSRRVSSVLSISTVLAWPAIAGCCAS